MGLIMGTLSGVRRVVSSVPGGTAIAATLGAGHAAFTWTGYGATQGLTSLYSAHGAAYGTLLLLNVGVSKLSLLGLGGTVAAGFAFNKLADMKWPQMSKLQRYGIAATTAYVSSFAATGMFQTPMFNKDGTWHGNANTTSSVKQTFAEAAARKSGMVAGSKFVMAKDARGRNTVTVAAPKEKLKSAVLHSARKAPKV